MGQILSHLSHSMGIALPWTSLNMHRLIYLAPFQTDFHLVQTIA